MKASLELAQLPGQDSPVLAFLVTEPALATDLGWGDGSAGVCLWLPPFSFIDVFPGSSHQDFCHQTPLYIDTLDPQYLKSSCHYLLLSLYEMAQRSSWPSHLRGFQHHCVDLQL